MGELLTPLPPGMFTSPVVNQALVMGINNLMLISNAITPVLVAANTTAEQGFNIPGLPLPPAGGIIIAVKPTVTAGIAVVGARISSLGVVQITYANLTAGGITPPSETYFFFVLN